MPRIITATDFSAIGKNAVNYACKLASAQHAQLIIIHSYIIPVMFSDVPMPVSVVDDAQHDAEEQMGKLVALMALTYPDVAIDGKVIYGDVVDAIEEYTKTATQPWMIIVGNNSTYENHTWPDSTLIEALKNLKYPVLAVPPGAAHNPVRNICFAFDNKHSGNEIALRQLTDITLQLNATLHVLNVQTDPEESAQDIDDAAKKMLTPVTPQYHLVADSNIEDAIQAFNVKNHIDLLVLIPRKHSFFEGLFHRSHTKAIVHHSHIPILALHEVGV